MRQQGQSSENNFTGGLKTEFTALNFPENACTETYNCIFDRTGNVSRRKGFNYEQNYQLVDIPLDGRAVSSFIWTNADGAGDVDIYVLQSGNTLCFFKMSEATADQPLSTKKLSSTVSLPNFQPAETTILTSEISNVECQYSTGNGYLFVYHPYVDTIYCAYDVNTDAITATAITIQIRDTVGIIETGVSDNTRPTELTDIHKYNLNNQGWSSSSASNTSSSTVEVGTGTKQWVLDTGVGFSAKPGDTLTIVDGGDAEADNVTLTGTVTNYISTSHLLTMNILSFDPPEEDGSEYGFWFVSSATAHLDKWFQDLSNYPSNSDVWWYFKNAEDTFSPGTTIDNVSTSAGPAPKGFFILDAFNQDRSAASGLYGLDVVSTGGIRPSTGAWYQGRTWYAGINSHSFSEKIYFSQIIETNEQFGKCYQTNDPTSEERFDLLPSDGGVIVLQGAGLIYKLFPIQNGLLVFAANGIWLITGSTGLGFTATDYSESQISPVRSISGTSFINVMGYPMWWNEEGIYTAAVAQGGTGVQVQSLTNQTIASFYKEIPLSSKKFVRGDYNPITLTVQWLYRSAEETDITTRYSFDTILNINTATGAIYPWSIAVSNTVKIKDIKYIRGTPGSSGASPIFKYLTSNVTKSTFSEEYSDTYTDWGNNFDSYFVTGYKLHGGAQRKFQANYIYVYSNNEEDTAYKIQGLWNYATSGNTGKWSSIQLVNVFQDNFSHAFRRHKIRGHGIALQFKILSVDGEPFSINGWSVWETVNQHA